jgi:hypothetical protein
VLLPVVELPPEVFPPTGPGPLEVAVVFVPLSPEPPAEVVALATLSLPFFETSESLPPPHAELRTADTIAKLDANLTLLTSMKS